MQKRGLSGIVVTVLIVLLAIASIVIIWSYVGKTITDSGLSVSKSSQEIILSQNRFSIVKSEVSNSGDITLVVKRISGQGNVSGINFVLVDENGNRETVWKEISLQVGEAKLVQISPSEYNGLGIITSIEIYPISIFNGEGISTSTSCGALKDLNLNTTNRYNIYRYPHLGFSSILNETTPGDAIASFTIASQNAEYILISTRVNWTAYVNGYQGITGDVIFDGVKQFSDSARYFGLRVYISIDPLQGGDRTKIDQSIPGSDKNFENESVRASYKNFAKRIAMNLTPDYLTLGMEVNTYYAANPSDFVNFVSLYNETYDFVKQSGMKIGPTFQWDEAKKNSQYGSFDYFKDKSDFFAVTSYPRVSYSNVASIPSDYYSSIEQYSNNKPIVIGESGWPTNSTSFPSTEQEQKEFVSLLLNETNKLDAELVVWWFMHDWKYPGYSDFLSTSGLLNSNGSAKLGWQVWHDYYMRERS